MPANRVVLSSYQHRNAHSCSTFYDQPLLLEGKKYAVCDFIFSYQDDIVHQLLYQWKGILVIQADPPEQRIGQRV